MYSIGEFSKVTSLSVKTIRHYHEKGILNPSSVDPESGYRFYGQKEVERARAIVYLKMMTFSLAEIAEILSDFEEEGDLVEFLKSKKAEIEKKVNQLQNVNASLESIIQREMEAKTMVNSGEFEVEEREMDGQLVAIYDWRGNYSETGTAMGKLYKAAGWYATGKPFNLYSCTEYEEVTDISSCVPVKKEFNADGIRFEKTSRGRCLSLIHKGNYEEIGRSYQAMIDYISEKGLKAGLPTREIYIKGPGMIFRGNPKNYLTEIQFPLLEDS